MNAWVLIKTLREYGCTLPIELWFMGPEEMDAEMIGLLRPLSVACVDACEVMKDFPVRRAPQNKGWQLKPYSIINSAFEEVLFIDADNVPTRDPACLFDAPEYCGTGAIFWPYQEPLPRGWEHLKPEENMWDICGIEFRVESSFETGQILVNKKECWNALRVTMHFNEHAEFDYPLGWGDTETFHFGGRLEKQPYYMVPFAPVDERGLVMFQHDNWGHVIFQHRNGDKWRWDGRNQRIQGFYG